MTNDEATEDMTEDKSTLSEMSHTNPYTGRVFGDTQTYSRGRTIAADGGEADSAPESETLGDVSHTPPGENDGAQRAYDRGKNR